MINWETVWAGAASGLRDHWDAGRGHLLTEDTLRMATVHALQNAVGRRPASISRSARSSSTGASSTW